MQLRFSHRQHIHELARSQFRGETLDRPRLHLSLLSVRVLVFPQDEGSLIVLRHFSRNKRMAEGIILRLLQWMTGFSMRWFTKQSNGVLSSCRSCRGLTTINSVFISVACLQMLSDEAVLLAGASSPSQVDGDKPESLLR